MKKKILLTLVIGLVIASCIDEISNLYTHSTNIEFSVDEAKSAFEREAEALEIKPFTTNPSTRENKETPTITPFNMPIRISDCWCRKNKKMSIFTR